MKTPEPDYVDEVPPLPESAASALAIDIREHITGLQMEELVLIDGCLYVGEPAKLRNFLGGPGARILLAVRAEAQAVLGALLYKAGRSRRTGRYLARLHNLCFRQDGTDGHLVSLQLMSEWQQRALDEGWDELQVPVVGGDEQRENFYVNHGFTRTELEDKHLTWQTPPPPDDRAD